MEFILLLVYILLLFSLFYKSKVYVLKPNTEYLGKVNSDSVKAVCAFIVMIHHISNEVECGLIMLPFKPSGVYMVAIFFFFSGYGLVYSLSTKSNYLHSFFQKRLPTILIPFILAHVIYSIYYFLSYKEKFFHSFRRIFTQLIGDDPFVKNSWFVLVLLMLYFIFWGCFRYQKHPRASWIIYCFLMLIYSFSVFIPHWSPSIIAFFIGSLWGKFKFKIDYVIIKYNFIFIIISCLVLAFSLIIQKMVDNSFFRQMCIVSFVIVMIAALTRVQFDNIILRFFGLFAFEIYLYHGLVMIILNKIAITKNNPVLYVFSTILLSIAISYTMYCLKRKFFAFWQKNHYPQLKL